MKKIGYFLIGISLVLHLVIFFGLVKIDSTSPMINQLWSHNFLWVVFCLGLVFWSINYYSDKEKASQETRTNFYIKGFFNALKQVNELEGKHVEELFVNELAPGKYRLFEAGLKYYDYLGSREVSKGAPSYHLLIKESEPHKPILLVSKKKLEDGSTQLNQQYAKIDKRWSHKKSYYSTDPNIDMTSSYFPLEISQEGELL